MLVECAPPTEIILPVVPEAQEVESGPWSNFYSTPLQDIIQHGTKKNEPFVLKHVQSTGHLIQLLPGMRSLIRADSTLWTSGYAVKEVFLPASLRFLCLFIITVSCCLHWLKHGICPTALSVWMWSETFTWHHEVCMYESLYGNMGVVPNLYQLLTHSRFTEIWMYV